MSPANTAKPPTAPPTIAPMLVLPLLELPVGVLLVGAVLVVLVRGGWPEYVIETISWKELVPHPRDFNFNGHS